MADGLHTEINVRHQQLNADVVTHLSTNWASRRLTLLIEVKELSIRKAVCGIDYLVAAVSQPSNALLVSARTSLFVEMRDKYAAVPGIF